MTWTEAIERMARNSNLNYDSDAGPVTVTGVDLSQWTGFLTDSINSLWADPEDLIWPWIMDVDDDVNLTAGTFATSVVDESDLVTIWSEDPRDHFTAAEDLNSYRLNWTLDGSNIRVQTDADAVVVFYRVAPPDWSWNGTHSDTLPDQLAPVVLADAERRRRLAGNTSEAEKLLERAETDYTRAYAGLLRLAHPIWEKAPWLRRFE